MGTKVEAPAPTAEETALRVEQTELLRSQREILLLQQKQQSALMPVFAKQLGLQLKFDKNGQIIGAEQTKDAMKMDTMQRQLMEKTLDQLLHPEKDPTVQRQRKLLDLQLDKLTEELNGPQAKQNAQIQKLLGERTLKALRGELAIDPALERDIKTQGQTLKDRLRGQLGAGFETSSAGIEAMQKFEEGATSLRHQARRGELTLAEQLGLARQGADFALGGASLGASQARLPGAEPLSSGGFAFGIGQGGLQNQGTLRQVLASPLGIAGGLGQVAQGFQMPIGSFMQDRQMQLDANIQNSQNSMAGLGAIGSVFGAILGMSDRRLKSNIELVGEWKEGVPIYAYDLFGVRRLGVMAQDLLGVLPSAVERWRGWLLVNYGALANE